MAWRLATFKSAAGDTSRLFTLRRWVHIAPRPTLDGTISCQATSPPLVLPEVDDSQSNHAGNQNIGFGFRSFFFGGSMELMAVPKRKTSPHKRGIRNGPRALKPTPIIIRCKGCGRVKLQHFYCCSGDRGTGEKEQ